MVEKKDLKHAYLIMAHSNFQILETLVELLNYENNDIYIHIDKKAKTLLKNEIKFSRFVSKIFFIESIDVKWGHYSQVECELKLIKAALENNYDYYHLLSGMDLPIKSQRYIQEFFIEHSGKEFIHFDNKVVNNEYKDRVEYYHFLQPYLRISKNKLINITIYYINRFFIVIQKLLKINLNKEINIQKGANWFSITHDLAKYVASKEKEIKKVFKYSANPDELFLQTIVENSTFKDKLYYNYYDNSYIACLRFIDWDRGNPYIWRIDDFDELINSKYLFARKFNENIDKEIIEKIKLTFIGK